jgi:NAD(P)H-hydrate epimerase
LTPHPGEFARLTGQETQAIQEDREKAAADFARSDDGRLVVALKGHRTVVTDGRRVYVNGTGNAGMATGGSGDCLTGVIASLLGQGLEPFDAACLGTYAHGLAGDIARDQNGEVGMIAGDIVDSLADAFYHIGSA